MLVDSGRKYHHLLLMDNPIRIKKVPLDESKYIREEPGKVSRVKRQFRGAVKRWHGSMRGVSKGVREALA